MPASPASRRDQQVAWRPRPFTVNTNDRLHHTVQAHTNKPARVRRMTIHEHGQHRRKRHPDPAHYDKPNKNHQEHQPDPDQTQTRSLPHRSRPNPNQIPTTPPNTREHTHAQPGRLPAALGDRGASNAHGRREPLQEQPRKLCVVEPRLLSCWTSRRSNAWRTSRQPLHTNGAEPP